MSESTNQRTRGDLEQINYHSQAGRTFDFEEFAGCAKNDSHPPMPSLRQTPRIGDVIRDTTPRIGKDPEHISNGSTMASLPIKMGGLGIRRATSLALPAFLTSAASTLPLQTLVLTSLNLTPDTHFEAMTSEWRSKTEFNDSESMPTHKQALWDKPLLEQTVKTLIQDTIDPYNTARLKAVSSPHASDWLHALPITACGLRLDNEDVRVAVGLRLGAAICEPHICACGARIDARGSHGLSCSLGFGRIARHNTINDIIHRSLSKAGIPSIKEPPGLLRTDGRRPGGLTMIQWRVVIWCGMRRW